MASTSEAVAASPSTLRPVAGLPPPDLALPVLAAVSNREQYRLRAEDETEEAQWYSAEAADTMVEPEQVRLKSLHSKAPSVVVFSNKTTYPVRALWLDFDGNEVVYSVLEPNTTKRYHTYVTHPWIVREVHSGTRMLLSCRPAVVGLSTEQTVEIQAPKQLPWTLDTHCCFPEDFKSEVKSLLLCHKKLEIAAVINTTANEPAGRPSVAVGGSCCRSTTSTAKMSTVQPPPAVPASPSGSACSTDALTGALLSPRRSLCCAAPLSPRAGGSSFGSVISTSSSGSAPSLCSISPVGMLAATEAHAPGATSSATSISISSEATHFMATLTLTSPKRAVLSSRLNMNIEVTTAGGAGLGSTTTNINIDTVLDGGDASTAVASTSSSVSGCISPVARRTDKKGLLNMFKSILHPKQHTKDQAPSTTTFKLQLQTAQDEQVLGQGGPCMAGTAKAAPVEEECCWPRRGAHLGHLPSHLVVYIAELAQPVCWQMLQAQPKGRPDIQPTIMACPPNLPEKEQLAEQDDDDEDDQGPPPLI